MRIKLIQPRGIIRCRQTMGSLILALALGVLAPASAIAAVTPHPPVPLAALQSFVAVYERIRQQHVDAKTDEELLQFALEGTNKGVPLNK